MNRWTYGIQNCRNKNGQQMSLHIIQIKQNCKINLDKREELLGIKIGNKIGYSSKVNRWNIEEN